MLDISDVEKALQRAVSEACYPGGVPDGDAPVSPSVGAPVRVRRGFPDAARLEADLNKGIVNISIFPMPGMSRVTTRYPRQWQQAGPATSTMTATVDGNTVLLAGTAGVQQLVGIRIDGRPYVVRADADDDPAAVAVTLAASISGASVAGSTITLSSSKTLEAKVAGFAPITRELRRQEQHVRVILWCPTPVLRDAAGSAVDVVMAATDFISLPGPAAGRLTYVGSIEDDVPSKENLWRRDLRYCIEYPTLESRLAPCVIFGVSVDLSAAA
jgi:hypothetical protein